jgi:urease subunit alpha
MGDGAACLGNCEPIVMRPSWGAVGRAPAPLSACFVHPLAIDKDVAGRLRLEKQLLPIKGTRKLTKADMLHNAACPKITVNPQTFDVFVDGMLATCEPVAKLPLGQKYFMR